MKKMVKRIKWYHYLWLWLIKSRYRAERQGDFIIAYRYKVAIGHVFVLEERMVTSYRKPMKFSKNP